MCVDENIEIKWNETTDIVIENEKKKGKVEILKIDSKDSNIKIKGAEFEILDEKGKVIDKQNWPQCA